MSSFSIQHSSPYQHVHKSLFAYFNQMNERSQIQRFCQTALYFYLIYLFNAHFISFWVTNILCKISDAWLLMSLVLHSLVNRHWRFKFVWTFLWQNMQKLNRFILIAIMLEWQTEVDRSTHRMNKTGILYRFFPKKPSKRLLHAPHDELLKQYAINNFCDLL